MFSIKNLAGDERAKWADFLGQLTRAGYESHSPGQGLVHWKRPEDSSSEFLSFLWNSPLCSGTSVDDIVVFQHQKDWKTQTYSVEEFTAILSRANLTERIPMPPASESVARMAKRLLRHPQQ